MDKKSIIQEIGQKGVYSGFIGRKLFDSIKYSLKNELVGSNGVLMGKDLDKRKRGGIIVLSTNATVLPSYISVLKDFISNKTTKWSIGHYFCWSYKSTRNDLYNEQSLALEVIEVDSKELIAITKELCNKLQQDSILVKDYNANKMYEVQYETYFLSNKSTYLLSLRTTL